MEERVARLESDVKHIQSDVSDIKAHLLRIDDKIDLLVKSVSELNVALVKSVSELKIWWLVTLLATVLGAVARALKWI